MGLFDRIFGGRATRPRRDNGYFQTFTAYRPTFYSWDGQLYESELVRAAVDARARHISKLQVTVQGAAKPRLQTRLRLAPNEFMTWSQFLYRVSTILDMQNTAFIVPVFDTFGDIVGIYPILPSLCELVNVDGDPWIRYRFNNGKTAAIALDECGVLTKHQYTDDFFGSNNSALNDTMRLINIQTQAVNEAVKNSNTFRFMARMTNFAKAEDIAKERRRFNRENLQDSDGGLLLFPNTFDNIQKIESKPYTVDAAQLELIRTNVFNYYGVNLKILQNASYGD